LKADHLHELSKEAIKYNDLVLERENMLSEHKKRQSDKLSENNRAITKIEEENQLNLQKQKEANQNLLSDISNLEKKHKEIISQIKVDTEKEIEGIDSKNREDQNKLTDIGFKAKGELQVTQKRLLENEQKMEEFNRSIKDVKDNIEKKGKKNAKLQEKKESNKKIIEEKNKEIADLEHNIYDLKKKTQELEKFKFVLDFKIKELKKDINPRNNEIKKLKKQTNKMDKKLKDFNRLNAHLGIMVKELQEKQNKMQITISDGRNSLRKNKLKKKEMKDSIYYCVQFIDDLEKLKRAVDEKLKQYINNNIKPVEVDRDIEKEYKNQRNYMEKSVEVYKKQLQRNSEVHRKDNAREREKNRDLINEIDKLRIRLKALKKETKGKSKMSMTGMPQISHPIKEDLNEDYDLEDDEEYLMSAKELSENKQVMEELKKELIALKTENDELMKGKNTE